MAEALSRRLPNAEAWVHSQTILFRIGQGRVFLWVFRFSPSVSLSYCLLLVRPSFTESLISAIDSAVSHDVQPVAVNPVMVLQSGHSRSRSVAINHFLRDSHVLYEVHILPVYFSGKYFGKTSVYFRAYVSNIWKCLT